MEFRRVLFRSTAIGNTHHCRPGTCSRDRLALAQGDALQRLYPSQPQGLPRPFERSGHWVPGTSPGTTALDRSEEHTSELQSLMRISYAVFCLKKKTYNMMHTYTHVSKFINVRTQHSHHSLKNYHSRQLSCQTVSMI